MGCSMTGWITHCFETNKVFYNENKTAFLYRMPMSIPNMYKLSQTLHTGKILNV
jgi:hypothetical protein